tara:strand:+ start:253 stop:918 length:666 start_codon:yes stop_codon:yes gene_type:complete
MQVLKRTREKRRKGVLVWDVFHRLWHWAFALTVIFSLVTGLMGDLTIMEIHMRLGYVVIGLLVFRCGWFFWGGQYARWRNYKPSWRLTLAYFKGAVAPRAHTPPGILMGLGLMVLVLVQALAGLFVSDDIINSGPLAKHSSDLVVDYMGWLHNRLFWLVIALVAVHLLAHAIYLYKKNYDVLSMFDGRKALNLQPAEITPNRGFFLVLVSTALVLTFLQIA